MGEVDGKTPFWVEKTRTKNWSSWKTPWSGDNKWTLVDLLTPLQEIATFSVLLVVMLCFIGDGGCQSPTCFLDLVRQRLASFICPLKYFRSDRYSDLPYISGTSKSPCTFGTHLGTARESPLQWFFDCSALLKKNSSESQNVTLLCLHYDTQILSARSRQYSVVVGIEHFTTRRLHRNGLRTQPSEGQVQGWLWGCLAAPSRRWHLFHFHILRCLFFQPNSVEEKVSSSQPPTVPIICTTTKRWQKFWEPDEVFLKQGTTVYNQSKNI